MFKNVDKIAHIEGLRGIAALIVCIDHFLVAFYPNTTVLAAIHISWQQYLYRFPLRILVGGEGAVYIFFLLSGFVLSARYFKTHQASSVLVGAVTRYFRLMIPVITSILLVYVLLKSHLFTNSDMATQIGDAWLSTFWQFKASLASALYQGFVGVFATLPAQTEGPNAYNPVLWTMFFELIGSLFIFFLMLFFGNNQKRWLLYVLIIVLFLKSCFLAFICGMLLCDIYHTFLSTKIIKRSVYGLGISFLLLILGLYSITSTPPTSMVFMGFGVENLVDLKVVTHVLGSLLIFATVWYIEPITRLLSGKSLQFLGKVSFSVYLLHFIILGSVSCFLFKLLLPVTTYNISFLITFGLSLGVIFPVSYLFYKYIDVFSVEQPKKIFRKYLGNYLVE
jgi:peptidoglycan/LPS O-acetylase OafA/YrhL